MGCDGWLNMLSVINIFFSLFYFMKVGICSYCFDILFAFPAVLCVLCDAAVQPDSKTIWIKQLVKPAPQRTQGTAEGAG